VLDRMRTPTIKDLRAVAARFIRPVQGMAMLVYAPGRPGGTLKPRLTGLVRAVR